MVKHLQIYRMFTGTLCSGPSLHVKKTQIGEMKIGGLSRKDLFIIREHPGDHNHQDFPELRYKWEVYCEMQMRGVLKYFPLMRAQ